MTEQSTTQDYLEVDNPFLTELHMYFIYLT